MQVGEVTTKDAVLTKGFRLDTWQEAALRAWGAGDEGGTHRGTLEVFTGGGKTLIALEAYVRSLADEPRLRLAVVVPTEALALQWCRAVTEWTTMSSDDVGVLGAGGRSSLRDSQVLVAVINSAAQYLPEQANACPDPIMLVVDECHRAGAPTFSRVLGTRASRRLGLSATPDREEVDDDGLPIDYDDHLLGRALGRVVFRFGLREAAAAGWLPQFEVHHHGVQPTPRERSEYEELTRRIDELVERLTAEGIESWRARRVAAGSGGDTAAVARAYVAATAARKDVLYRATERGRVARLLVAEAVESGASRIILFHERVAAAERLAQELGAELGQDTIALEHSGLSDAKRRTALDEFRSGVRTVLVSVRSLIEGINVPEADVGVSVASSSSVRQRVQSLGRVLRRGSGGKTARMHVLYVRDTTDEAIYAKEDWSDMTGPSSNRYWSWSLGQTRRVAEEGPPRTPRALEEDEWDRHGKTISSPPRRWEGVLPEAEYSVDTLGNVTTPSGSRIANPQGVGTMLSGAGKHAGRFRVTPAHRLVLTRPHGPDADGFLLVGQLDESFRPRTVATSDTPEAVIRLEPGEGYVGPGDKDGGTFLLRSQRGGVVARKTKGGYEFAVSDPSRSPTSAANVAAVLRAWHSLGSRGRPFHVDSTERAWTEAEGRMVYLADVPGGFVFGSDFKASEGNDGW